MQSGYNFSRRPFPRPLRSRPLPWWSGRRSGGIERDTDCGPGFENPDTTLTGERAQPVSEPLCRDDQGTCRCACHLSRQLHWVSSRELIELAVKHRLPTMCGSPVWSPDGGLISYGHDRHDQFRRAAIYVDKILKGTKPADLPVPAADEV